MRPVKMIKCTHVAAQVNLGYYDAEGNLIGEESFPQTNGTVVTARLFYPHEEQFTRLIEMCIKQAWEKLPSESEPGGSR